MILALRSNISSNSISISRLAGNQRLLEFVFGTGFQVVIQRVNGLLFFFPVLQVLVSQRLTLTASVADTRI